MPQYASRSSPMSCSRASVRESAPKKALWAKPADSREIEKQVHSPDA